jgi:hypothetical protein
VLGPPDARADGLGLWLPEDPEPGPHEIAMSAVTVSIAIVRIRANQL